MSKQLTYRFEPLSEDFLAYRNGARQRIVFEAEAILDIKAFFRKAREEKAFWIKDEGDRQLELFVVQWPGAARFQSCTEADILGRVRLLS